MTLHLIYDDAHTLLTSDRPVIKRADRKPLETALDALREASALRGRATADAEGARRTARAEGLAEARAAINALVADRLAELSAEIERHAEARRTDIADAAFAATRAIIGSFEPDDLLGRIVDRTMARIDGDAPVTIEVAPAMAENLAQRLAASTHVTIVSDDLLGPTECRIRGGQGQIVASLAVQLDALAARWGIVSNSAS